MKTKAITFQFARGALLALAASAALSCALPGCTNHDTPIAVTPAVGVANETSAAPPAPPRAAPEARVHYRTANADGVKIFYREAGPAGAPDVLLLHGFGASSAMFRDLVPVLASRYAAVPDVLYGEERSGYLPRPVRRFPPARPLLTGLAPSLISAGRD